MSGATILLDDPVQSEVDRRAEAGDPVPRIERRGPGGRRRQLATCVVAVLEKTVADPESMEILLDGTAPGHAVPSTRRAAARVVIHGPDALARLLLPPTGDAFTEAYLRGDLDIEGDVTTALLALRSLDLRRLRLDDLRRVVRWTLELRSGTPEARRLERISRMTGGRHSRARDMEAIRFHYDVGNDFYSLWLDVRLAYSCAYFPDGTTAVTAPDLLDGAQEAKLDLIARKLRIGPETRLLDIGSGWGSLINFAAERYGSETVGVTLSQRQADASNRRAAGAGLDGRAVAHVLDYRDLSSLGMFDAIASVGMFEHVGRANLRAYFRAAHGALKPGGLFLNHGIAASGPPAKAGLRPRPGASHFLERYVFPDGELVAVEDAVTIARRAGFEVIDVQSLRAHYALTLAAWVGRLEANWTAAVDTAGEEVARTWRLYMSAARLGFERGELDVCQLLLAKPADGGPAATPLRPWW